MKPALAASLLLLLTAPLALAQSGPGLIVATEFSPLDSRTYTSAYGISTDADSTGDDVDLASLSSEGFVRLTARDNGSYALGYEVDFLGINSNSPLLPERMLDTSVAFGGKLTDLEFGEWGDWKLSGTIGVGHASTEPFNDSDGWYGKASLVASRQIDPQSFLSLSVFYNGNATVFPDIPLPGFLYQTQLNDETSVQLGFPFSGVVWTPDDRWTVGVRYLLPIDFELDVEYRLNDTWALFASFYRDAMAVDEADSDSDDRLFFRESRVELGARWRLFNETDIELAGGYAFDQEFERGWDLRDTDSVEELDDAPYARLGLILRF